ncbi:MAG: NADPH-dependent F420 reductase [Acidimicrobiales bacterium]
MRIGVVGAGNIGTTLTKRFTAVGHEVSVANSRGPETLADLASSTGAHAASLREATKGAEVVVVTIPEGKVPDLPSGFLDGAAGGAVVIDTCNYYPQRDGRIEAIENGMTESRWVSRQIGHPVVKAFNNIQAQHLLELGRPKGTPGRIALPVAGDEAAAKAVVMRLVDEIGFDPIDAGGLDDSWRQQPGSPVYATDLDADGVRRALAEAKPARGPH